MTLMQGEFFRHNVFVVENGQLVPRAPSQPSTRNYRYIPYNSTNNPQPQDYFRETISKLKKDNSNLENTLTLKLEELQKATNLNAQSQTVKKLQAEIQNLKNKLLNKQQLLKEKDQIITQKDRTITQVKSQITKMQSKVDLAVKQVQNLQILMVKKDSQILQKKEKIDQYCRKIERMVYRDKEQSKTMFSENNLMTPKVQITEEDDFYSEQESPSAANQQYNRRFLTPQLSFSSQNKHTYSALSTSRTSNGAEFDSQTIKKELGSRKPKVV